MGKSTIMKILAVICVLLGYSLAYNVLETRIRTLTVQDSHSFYEKPSVTVASCTKKFRVGEELLVLEMLELKQPTAVLMLKDTVLDGADNTKYKLERGAVYAVQDARLDKANQTCVISVHTTKGERAELEVAKENLAPVDEGTWAHVRSKDGTDEGWIRTQTRWY